jgi:hypothetical protein
MNLLQLIESTTLDAGRIAASTAQIHAVVLRKSKGIDDPNFRKIHTADIELLFAEYDARFFEGQIKASLGTTPLHFSLSKRMTRSGGKTACYTDPRNGKRRYEIGVATDLLFGCFSGEDHRPITASGIVCRDRLDALRILLEGAPLPGTYN